MKSLLDRASDQSSRARRVVTCRSVPSRNADLCPGFWSETVTSGPHRSWNSNTTGLPKAHIVQLGPFSQTKSVYSMVNRKLILLRVFLCVQTQSISTCSGQVYIYVDLQPEGAGSQAISPRTRGLGMSSFSWPGRLHLGLLSETQPQQYEHQHCERQHGHLPDQTHSTWAWVRATHQHILRDKRSRYLRPLCCL